MVPPNCYSTDVRRYDTRMNLYSSYPDRRGAAYPVYPNTRTTIMSERDDDLAPQRKRIAVACGRCRKRKIRCSGDTGNGGPCTNCKNAGYEPCQFLRVASTETPMKNESFNYNLEASRRYQAGGNPTVPSVPSTTPSYPDGLPASYASDPLVYRTAPAFGYGAKPYCPWTHGYPDDQNCNYAMYQPPYHDSDYSNIGFRIASGTGKSALCVDTEPNYAYSSAPTATSLVHRPAQVVADSSLAYQSMVPDSKSMVFQNMGADSSKSLGFQNMAVSVNMGDRVLPAPVGRSAMPNLIGPTFKTEPGSSLYSGSSSKSSQASTSETSPVSSISETPSSYTSYESSSMASTSSCLPSYPATSLAGQYGRSSSDIYSPTVSSDAPLFASSTDAMRHGLGIPYRYHDTATTVAAAAGSSTARRDMPTLNGSSIGSLSLGHSAAHYLPH
ncbi:putative transcriptional regulatory protein C2H10.01 [Fusarium austroafricanum]|uniref:Putative transcriptional regulatory protein C2H10.01 n=1 Tax=Fusarium austroafricanum TaxID=2364996 RepID=A0A8H4P2K3_9HYPO|nr:putative transcriptional regulatory protein C2H10.01 [Fusarium austroafricanum]